MFNNKQYVDKNFQRQKELFFINNMHLIAPKLLNQFILSSVFLVVTIICLSIFLDPSSTFERKDILYTVKTYSYHIKQTAGGIGLYAVIWYTAVNIFVFFNISTRIKTSKRLFFILLTGLILNFYAHHYIRKNIVSKRDYLTITFYWILSDRNLIEFNIRDKKSIFALICLFIFIPFMVFSSIENRPVDTNIIIPNKNTITEIVYAREIWFSNLHYFTTEGNWMCILTLFFVFLNHRARFLKHNVVILSVLSYIMIVGLVWLCILYPVFSSNETWIWFNSMTGFYDHVVTPLTFLAFSIFIFVTNPHLKKIGYANSLKVFIFYLCIYNCYVTFLPVVANVSVYGMFTNIWPMVNGNAWFTFVQIGAFGLMIFIHYLFYLIANSIIKRNIKKFSLNITAAQTI
ncbi:DUF1600 domain-containing protein [Ureaplasma canigenitalium]|uniref:DUF1600 domain-containing protein n=1 Tax=Ureaplasma canigenitalium TaxID=42092 RepID=UPI00069204DF|nr:DUF1600 domain-containing protein [Ureaplasma canigenitalium]